jgi:hypothetical protein
MIVELPIHQKVVLLAMGMVLLALSGCSTCDRVLKRVESADKQHVAEPSVSGLCGGATVGYSTHLTLTRSQPNLFGDNGSIWATRGWADAQLKWLSPNHLDMTVPAGIKGEDAYLQTIRWYDITISYVSASPNGLY